MRRHADATSGAALERFERGCEDGDAASCSVLGVMYERGRGVARDEREAARLYAHACRRGNVDACVNLGQLHLRGEGASRDVDGALSMFELACHGGSGEGCYELGRLRYQVGDVASTRHALAAACDEEHADACLGLGALYEHGHGVARSRARAHELYRRSCRYGQPAACERLGPAATSPARRRG